MPEEEKPKKSASSVEARTFQEYKSLQTHTLKKGDRIAAGKALRDKCGRNSHADWEAPTNRVDPVDLLIENCRGRLEDLIPIRYGRMSANPFAFYRGAAAIMAYDLSHTPSTGMNLQICGDCHLVNFGGFATAERRLIFDINDFDETSLAPWEWDVKRLAASFVIAGRSNGFNEEDCREAAWLAVQSYRQYIWEYSGMPVLDAWYDTMDLNEILDNFEDRDAKRFYAKKLQKATEQSAHEKEFAELAFISGNEPRIIDQPPLIFHYNELHMEAYRREAEQGVVTYMSSLSPEKRVLLERFQLVDLAFKVVGVGSVGTFCGIALFMSGNGEPLFLQFKQAQRSVLEPYAGSSPFTHPGQRVVVGQKLMQTASDIFMGWFTGTGPYKLDFYVRQLKDAKIKPVVELMKPSNLKNYAGLCGHSLARAHVRSGDAAVLAGYMGKGSAFEDALADFSVAYADQNERDYAALVGAIRSGRIEAQIEA
jgi:uncharacterized protein (DUF2252 family)